MQMSADFYTEVRPLFGGKLTQKQVDALNKLVEYARKWEYSVEDAAFVMGQIAHETNKWMEPIREGAARFGTNYTNAQSIAAVTQIYSKGIIRTNYALPAGPYKQSYYGRGHIQITWYDNYLKFDNILGLGGELVKNPDKALDWDISTDIAFIGCRDGVFTGKAMSDYSFPAQYADARAIVNGDVKKNGKLIAGYCETFRRALLLGGYNVGVCRA